MFYSCFVFCVEVAFFSLVAGMSIVSGFATTLMLAKRRDSEMFDKVTKALIMLYDLSNIGIDASIDNCLMLSARLVKYCCCRLTIFNG